MRKFSLVALFLVMAFSMTACVGAKVGVINPSRLFQDSESGKAGIAHLKQIETDMQAQLTVAQEMLKKSPEDEALRTRFQQTFAGYQQLITAEQEKVVESVNKQLRTTLDAYRGQKGLSAILNGEAVMSYAPDSDVTDGVLAEMNKAPLAFSPVKLDSLQNETPAVAPAAPAASKATPKAQPKK